MEGMTQERWDRMSAAEKDAVRSDAGLTPQLVGLEGWRVEVVDQEGETRRFIVGRSSGWIPCHIEISRRNAHGGFGASDSYRSVRKLYKVR